MTDDMQRAMELLPKQLGIDTANHCGIRLRGYTKEQVLGAITAALRAAPEGPATHYHCKDGIHGTIRRLRRYSTTAINRNSLQGQTMEEAAAFIEHVLAARPQGVKE